MKAIKITINDKTYERIVNIARSKSLEPSVFAKTLLVDKFEEMYPEPRAIDLIFEYWGKNDKPTIPELREYVEEKFGRKVTADEFNDALVAAVAQKREFQKEILKTETEEVFQ